MKKIFFLLIAAGGALSAIAQKDAGKHVDTTKKDFSQDAALTKWVIDANILGGIYTQDIITARPDYTNGVNNSISALKYNNGMSYGADVQVGYFFTKNNNGA